MSSEEVQQEELVEVEEEQEEFSNLFLQIEEDQLRFAKYLKYLDKQDKQKKVTKGKK